MARIRPISRVRSTTDRARVFTTPRTATMIASAEQAVDHVEQLVDLALDQLLVVGLVADLDLRVVVRRRP